MRWQIRRQLDNSEADSPRSLLDPDAYGIHFKERKVRKMREKEKAGNLCGRICTQPILSMKSLTVKEEMLRWAPRLQGERIEIPVR